MIFTKGVELFLFRYEESGSGGGQVIDRSVWLFISFYSVIELDRFCTEE
jgi:hypothetical protein